MGQEVQTYAAMPVLPAATSYKALSISLLANPAFAMTWRGSARGEPLFDYRRAIIAAGVAVGHLALFWLVLRLSGLVVPLVSPDRTLITVEIADVPAASAPAKPAPVLPVPVSNPPVLLPSAIMVPARPTASGSGVGAGCGMAGVVGRAIAADPAAMAALAAVPAGVRTDADAVMLWNGGWLDVGGAPPLSLLPTMFQSDPLSALKQTVVAALAASPPDCRDLSVSGPQLIPIVEPGRTTMLVIGSGIWKWTDLIDPAVVPPDAGVLASSGPVGSGPPQPAAGKSPLN